MVNDELGCYGGCVAYFSDTGLVKNICENQECPHFIDVCRAAFKVVAVWDKDGYSWVYETDIPHVTFGIIEDGERYCQGIVFDIKDCKGKGTVKEDQVIEDRYAGSECIREYSAYREGYEKGYRNGYLEAMRRMKGVLDKLTVTSVSNRKAPR